MTARLMRRILVDIARRRISAKRRGRKCSAPLEDAMAVVADRADPDLVALDLALEALHSSTNARAASSSYGSSGD